MARYYIYAAMLFLEVICVMRSSYFLLVAVAIFADGCRHDIYFQICVAFVDYASDIIYLMRF